MLWGHSFCRHLLKPFPFRARKIFGKNRLAFAFPVALLSARCNGPNARPFPRYSYEDDESEARILPSGLFRSPQSSDLRHGRKS